jgi:predicted O-methyltransferase YrrM
MKPAQLDVFVAMFCYGGNGGVGMQLPEITVWYAKTHAEMAQDPRIGRIECMRFGDVPLTMERNRAVRAAKDRQCDVLLMIDSDNVPDLYLNVKPWAKPFWKTSFDFLYERKLRGLPSVVCAPYCGPPPHPVKGGLENVYVFHGEANESDVGNQAYLRFQAYSREHAAQMRGLQSIVAGPTGVIVYTLDALDLMAVHSLTDEQILHKFQQGELTMDRAIRLINMKSWFFYEYTNHEQTQKASTEDVTNTREIQLAGLVKHKEPIVFCNWDAWAGHYKPKCVGMPEPIFVDHINENYLEAVERGLHSQDTLQDVNFTDDYDGPVLSEDDDEVPVDVNLDNAQHDDPKSQGVETEKRMVFGHPVTSVGHQTNVEDLQAFADIVRAVAKNRPSKALRIVEVGSWVGESTLALHSGLGPAGGTIWCVDTWEGTATDLTGHFAREFGFANLFDVFKSNIGELLDEDIKCMKGDSVDVAESMEPQELDIVMLDAGHDYDSVRDDIDAWLPHVANDGVLCGHDWNENFPGVMKAVKETTDTGGIMPTQVGMTNVWYFRKSDYVAGLAKKQAKKEARAKKKSSEQTIAAEAATDEQPAVTT